MLVLYLPHNATWMYEGAVAHIQGGKGFACKVEDHIMELVMTKKSLWGGSLGGLFCSVGRGNCDINVPPDSSRVLWTIAQ